MNPFLIIIIGLVALVALYFLVAKKTRAGPGNLRDDSTERPELRGPEQYKRREMK